MRTATWQRAHDEDGAALISVVLITVLIVSLIGVVVAATATNLRGSSLDRKRTQTAAAAEAGVDATLANLQISSGTAVPCTLTGNISNATYTATVAYYATYPPSGAPMSCANNAVSSTPKAALVTSVGSGPSAYDGAATTFGDRTMTALVRLTGSASTGPVLDKAVFSDASLSLTNSWKLNSVGGSAANLYTNGDFSCNSTPIIAGSVYAQGGANVTNTCWMDGDLWTNGSITTSTGNVHVGGSIKSHNGGLSEGNSGIFIGKDVMVKGACCGGSSSPKAGDGRNQTAGGTIYPNGTDPGAPPSSSMPQIKYDPSAFPGFTVQTWANWERDNATANGAPTWSSAYDGDCSVAAGNYSLNGPLTSPTSPTIIDARGCNLSFNGIQLKLKSDLTIFANDFYSTQGLSASSANGATLRIIVPWPANATNCSNSNAGNIKFDSGGTVLPSNVQMLLYSAGDIYLTNGMDFYGQVYGCSVAANSQITVRFVPVGAGGGSGGGTTPYSVDVAYLRDS